MSNLKSKLLYQLSLSLFYCIIPVIVFPYISRVLGPGNVGRINFIDYIAQFFILFASFGIPLYGAREVAKARSKRENLFRITSELVVIHLIFTSISLLIFAMLIIFKQKQFGDHGLVILAAINLLSSCVGLEWFITGLEDFKFLAKRSFLIKILGVVFIFLFIRRSSDYTLYYTILTGSNILLLAIDVAYVLKKGNPFVSRHFEIKKHFRSLAVFFLTTITLSVYTFFDTAILGFIAGSLAVGFYTTSLKIIRLSQNFINDVSSILLPRISYLIETGNKTEVTRLINKSLQYVFTVTLPLCFFIFLASREIILVLGGEKFFSSIEVLKMLAALPLIIGFGNIFFMQVLLPVNKEKVIFWGVLMGSIASITSNLILCPIYAEKGAAISCIAAEAIVAIFLGWQATRHVQMQIPLRLLGQILITCVLFIPIVLLTRNLVETNLVILITEGVLCAVSYFLIQQLVFKNPIINETVRFFRNNLLRGELTN